MNPEVSRAIDRGERLGQRLAKLATNKPLGEVILGAAYLTHSIGESMFEREPLDGYAHYDEAVDALMEQVYSASEGDLGEALILIGLALGKMAVTAEELED
jgi:hypothetical protein